MRTRGFLLLAFAGSFLLHGAEEQRLALTIKAQTAFDRVQLAADPSLRDLSGCVQAQAALVPIAGVEELPLVEFRKAYCMVGGAAISRSAAEFAAAAAEFDKAVSAWHARAAFVAAKNRMVEPTPSAFLIFGALARLGGGADRDGAELAGNTITAALAEPWCPAAVMPASSCEAVARAGHEWLGWLALRDGKLDEAAAQFANANGSGWLEWASGMQAFLRRNYRGAAADYRQAIRLLHPAAPSLLDKLGPPADEAAETVELGGAELLLGDTNTAIATLNAAVKVDPSDARAIYLRGRAKELAGQTEAALADYNLASRTAFANARDLASGEAHLYRGILYYRRNDYSHAEDEFASALNFTIGSSMRADAVAWRHLAAVAAGSCEASRERLERSLAGVSPYFPSGEAQARMAGCSAGAHTAQLGAR